MSVYLAPFTLIFLFCKLGIKFHFFFFCALKQPIMSFCSRPFEKNLFVQHIAAVLHLICNLIVLEVVVVFPAFHFHSHLIDEIPALFWPPLETLMLYVEAKGVLG